MVLLLAAPAATAAIVEGSTARAFGVRVHLSLLGRDLATIGPLPLAKAPDASAENPNDVSKSVIGPIRIPPDTGQILSDLRVLSAHAKRTSGDHPSATGEASVAHLALFEQDGVPLIEADAIKAVSNTVCTAANKASTSAEGSRLVGLRIQDQLIDATPPPNTVIPLETDGGTPLDPTDDRGIKIILNEQTGAQNGNGLIVTMLHVIVYDAIQSNLIFADIKISEARSSAFCGNDSPPTNGNGDDRDVTSDKAVTTTDSDLNGSVDGTEATVRRGETVTWEITITNMGTQGCGVVVVSDSLPQYFTFVKSSGDLTKAVTPTVDEGGVITWSNPARWTLNPSTPLKETIVAKVADNAPFGTYLNLIDVEESTCSSFTQGLRGPVTVVEKTTVLGVKTPAQGTLPTTGLAVSPLAMLAFSLALLSLGGLIVRRDA